MQRGEPFQINAGTLARAGASEVLALDVSALGTMMTLAEDDPREEQETEGTNVALVDIDGPLAKRGQRQLCGYLDGYDWIADRVSSALADSTIGAVVLRLDSPGGDVAGLEEAVRRMTEAREASGKTIVAYVDELAASAAYWIAAAVADEIIVPTAGRVGSIGVIGAYIDETKALEAEGHGVKLVREPEGKAAMHPAGPVTEVADERLQKAVHTTAQRFYSAIAGARDLKTTTISAFNGATFEGHEAVEQGLADKVGTFEEALELAKAAASERQTRMEKRIAALAAFGLAATATDEELFEAAATHNTDAQLLGEEVRSLTGKDGSFDALEVVEGWRTGASEHDAAKQELEALQISNEAAERDAQCVKLVTDAGKGPAAVWADPVVAKDRSKRAPVPHLAKMSLEDLRSFVDSEVTEAKARPALRSTPVVTDDEHTAELSEFELAYCKRENVNPATFAAVKRRTQQQKRAES